MPTVLSPDGVSIAYDVTGPRERAGDTANAEPAVPPENPPCTVVLLHGSALSRAIWRGLGYLRPLAETRRVVRIDLRGHGRSGRPHSPGPYTQDHLAADVLAVLDAVGAERASLVGYSLGARVALHVALRHPERVDCFASLGGSAAQQQGTVDSIFFPGVIDALRTGGMEAFCAGQGLGPDTADRFRASTRAAFLTADPLAMAALFTATDATPGIDDSDLAACDLPALWMAGDLDEPRRTDSEHAAAIMPRGRFVGLPGRRHADTLVPAAPVLDELATLLPA